MATIQQIADRAGVSRGTVDRALNERGRINPDVAERIRRIADEMGYVPSRSRYNRQVKKQAKIGVLTQLAKTSFMNEIQRGIEEAGRELADYGTRLILREVLTVDEKEQLAAIRSLVRENIDGLALMPVDCERVRTEINRLVETLNIPVVTFNSDIVGTKRTCFVGMDNTRSGYVTAGLMGMLTRGCGKVLIITGFFSNFANSARVDGFLKVLKRDYPALELAGVHASFDEVLEVENIITKSMLDVSGITGIYVASGGQEGIARAFGHLKLEKRPHVVIYDKTPENIALLKENMADFLIDQEGFYQGYHTPRVLANMIIKNQYPEREYLYTDIKIMTKFNIL